MNIFDQMLAPYKAQTAADHSNALHEVMQQITLAGLQRGGFFNKAAFYGGTCLRIFHGLNRFSEDMDFSLLRADDTFSIAHYSEAVENEFKALGRSVIIEKKETKKRSNIESAFLKEDTSVYNLRFTSESQIKIKLEVDLHPPGQFSTEQKLSLLPFSFMTRCYSLPDLYAGKMHALLFRNWKTRVKGRDWYDFEWYVRNNTPLNFNHLYQRVVESSSVDKEPLTRENFVPLLKHKISKTNMDAVKADLRPFIKNPAEMDIWSVEYFTQLADRIQFVE
ncbi:MAG: nucleotidyl transferase AbiEii/AbiGii toxin family protein [Bacteroidales bacterium]|nr:nucleotidyl transferase AbiEii/AbiGii toxin family protein [Bacteroidales bacterium]